MISELADAYRAGGLHGAFAAVWKKTTRNSPLYYAFDELLGARLHEKVIMAPVLGYWPNLTQPRSFNEHIVHRKLYSDNDIYSTVSDKHAVREFVRDRVGSQILNSQFHVTNDPQTLPFEDFPDEFVVKATHGQGMNIIVRNKADVDFEGLRARCENWLAEPFGRRQREYWYRDIAPQIVVEELLQEPDGTIPEDYKFYVFQGEVEYVHVDFDRFGDHKRRYYDASWNALDIRRRYPLAPVTKEPNNFDRMKLIAESLGEGFDFARVDLYDLGSDGVTFGEITLAPGSGHSRFRPKEADFQVGSLW